MKKATTTKKPANKPSGNMYAFWNYDQYPYFLCGTISGMRDDGLVSIKEFGGAMFKPVLILPRNAGLKLKEKLSFLERTYRDDLKTLQKTAEERLLNHIPELAETRKKR